MRCRVVSTRSRFRKKYSGNHKYPACSTSRGPVPAAKEPTSTASRLYRYTAYLRTPTRPYINGLMR
eukprot:5492376-Pyramimonas_sp.AAC.1